MDYKYKKQITTKEISREKMLTEIESLIPKLIDKKIVPDEIYFGWAWQTVTGGFDVSPDIFCNLPEFIRKKEKELNESFGENDIFLTFDKYKARIEYTHDSEIILRYDEESELVKIVKNNWAKNDIKII